MDDVIVAVAHDEFRRMGLSGVRGFMDEGAVVVDVRRVFDGEGVEGMGFIIRDCKLLLTEQRMDSIQIYKWECGYNVYRNKRNE